MIVDLKRRTLHLRDELERLSIDRSGTDAGTGFHL